MANSMPSNTARQFSPAPLQQDRGFGLVGRVEVPRLHLSAMIAEGASSRVLRVAVGHVPGTSLPWQSGNVVLAAHRDSFFRHLGELKTGDVIRIIVPGSQYDYRVTFTEIVQPRETWVLQPATGKTLTLITCYPFHYIGPATDRFVVRARQLDAND
jgi:sortase A